MDQSSQDQLENLVDGIITALFQGGEVAAEAYVTAQVPVLADPILQAILDDVIGYVASSVEKNVLNAVNAIVFDIQTSGENSVVLKAAQSLQAAQLKGEQGAIQSATQSLINSYQGLIHNDGGGVATTS